jgi:ATP-dependent Lon protease
VCSSDLTGTGGDVLFIEANATKGSGKLTLTGQLGDVMKESAKIAQTYVHAHAEDLGIDPEVFGERDLHLHVPAGAIPKDGPSAGITMATALASLLSGRPVRDDVAMTGEITLTGQVLPIGGLKEKALAAQRFGIKHVLAPAQNAEDVEDIPEHLRAKLRFTFVERIEEVLEHALRARPVRRSTKQNA